MVRTLVSAGELSLSCAKHWTGDHFVVKPSAIGKNIAVVGIKGKGSSLDIAPLTIGLLGPQYAASRHTTSQSTTLGLHPVIHVPN